MAKRLTRKDSVWYNILCYGLEYMGLYYGKYRALVISNEDPDNLNRLQLLVPDLNDLVSDQTWAWPVNVWGGKNYGTNLLPQKGDMVWVEFEYGRVDYPIWSHGGYALDEKPEEYSTVNHYGFKTPRGTILLINDNDDKEEVLIKLATEKEWLKLNIDTLELESKLIKLGKEGKEQALMGNTTHDLINNLMIKIKSLEDNLSTHTHQSPVGPTSPQIQNAISKKIGEEIEELRTNKLKEILSDKVRIDK